MNCPPSNGTKINGDIVATLISPVEVVKTQALHMKLQTPELCIKNPLSSENKQDKILYRFNRMHTPEALKLANLFLVEERSNLKKFFEANEENLKKLAFNNFIAVGGGKLTYYDMALNYVKHYVVIDPVIDAIIHSNANSYIQNNENGQKLSKTVEPNESNESNKIENITLVNKPFSKNLKKIELPSGNSIYFFLFNVLSYIDDPINCINNIINPGDIIIISGWNMKPQSITVLNDYFNYVDKRTSSLTEDEIKNLSKQKELRFNSIHYFEGIEYKIDNISEFYIITTQNDKQVQKNRNPNSLTENKDALSIA